MDAKQYRSATLYVTPQLHRWLVWLAMLEEGKTADELADRMLRGVIIQSFPNIEEVEMRYHAGRNKLNTDAKESLKGITT